jgi:signal transduction histidine kinase
MSRQRARVGAGRALAAAAVLSAAYGIAVFIASGQVDYIAEDYVLQQAIPAAGFGLLVWLALPHQPHNRAIWVAAAAALASGIGIAGWGTGIMLAQLAGLNASPPAAYQTTPAQLPPAAAVALMLSDVGWLGILIPTSLGLLLFPDGDLPSPRWRPVAWASAAAIAGFTLTYPTQWLPGSVVPYGTPTDQLTGVGRLAGPFLAIATLLSGLAVAALVRGYRRSRGVTRQQYRWIGWGTGVLVVVVAGTQASATVTGVQSAAWQRIPFLLGIAAAVSGYAVAVGRYHLYDVELVISRTLVYGALATFIGLMYVGGVVALGGLVAGGVGDLPLAIGATAVVAIAFQPLQRRLQHTANRLVYGPRATPYEVISDLTQRLAGTEPAQSVLERMAQLMADTTRAVQSTVWLADGDRLIAAAGFPVLPKPVVIGRPDDLSGVVRRVEYRGDLVGALQVIPSRGDRLRTSEQQLLGDLAGSAGLILGNQRLNAALAVRAAELSASRERLLQAQEVERQRMERDLDFGVRHQVTELLHEIGSAEGAARLEDAAELAELLADLATEVEETLLEITELARGFRPPLLEAEGVLIALRSEVASLPIPVEIVANGVGRLPSELESALYFTALEAIANAVKHGAASSIGVRLTADVKELVLEVADDGVGFDYEATPVGTGMRGIRDRIEGVGGRLQVSSTPGRGTRLEALVPLPAAEPAPLRLRLAEGTRRQPPSAN